MKYVLTGETGGIGSAIKEALQGHTQVEGLKECDWLILAHGIIREKDARKTLLVNTWKCIVLTEEYLPFLKKGVIYISSTAAFNGNGKFPVYSASKAALNIYSKSMAKAHPELGFYALCPGPTNTKLWRSLELGGNAQNPSEVARAVLDILIGNFVSGDTIVVREGVISKV